MDKQLLEFWGNALINMAKSQEQMESMTKWMHQGMKLGLNGMEAWTKLCNQTLGPAGNSEKSAGKKEEDKTDPIPPQARSWEKSMQDLQASLSGFYDFMGVVPKQEHMRVVQKCEAMKQRIADLEETVKHLRMMQKEENGDQSMVVKDFKRMIAQQTEQFQELIKNTEKLFNYSPAPTPPAERE